MPAPDAFVDALDESDELGGPPELGWRSDDDDAEDVDGGAFDAEVSEVGVFRAAVSGTDAGAGEDAQPPNASIMTAIVATAMAASAMAAAAMATTSAAVAAAAHRVVATPVATAASRG